MIRAAALLAAMLPGVARAGCGQVEHPMTLAVRGDAVIARGQIVQGDAADLAAMVATARPKSIVLDSNGGDIGEAAAMADTIRVAGLSVTVPARAMCASACFMLLAAGRDRTVSPTSQIGVHRAASCSTGDSQVGTNVMSAKAIAFGTPAGIVRRMVSTPQPATAWLGADELMAMGVRVLP